tara:strand:- start:315 stop:680 length:366 start_codon:yes stop_codon:yes gene_type:complete
MITIAFSFWLSFKFDFLRTKLVPLSKILEVNSRIFEVFFICFFILLIVCIFYFLLRNKKIDNFTRSFFVLFFLLQFLFSLFFIFLNTIKDKIYNNEESLELTQNFFSDFEIQKINEDKKKK